MKIKICKVTLYVFLISFIFAQTTFAWVFERRTEQFKKGLAYAVLPVPFSIPGVGNGLGVGAGAQNIADTYIDVYGLAIFGDVEGQAIGLSDIHLIEKTLIFDIGYSSISKAAFVINNSRGMDGDEDPDEFNMAEISDSTYLGGQLTLTFFERMLESTIQSYRGSGKVETIRDSEGNILAEFEDVEPETSNITYGNFILDLTDDRHDPRNGFRTVYSRNFPSGVKDDEVAYYTADINTTIYIPLLTNSTLAFNYFRSDAYVQQKGETDRDVIAAETGLQDCIAGDTECEEANEAYIDTIVASNKYGNASSLGGLSRLRSFTSMRYRGAHTRFAGAEFRWNLTDEKNTFDILFMKDIRTSVQLAFFHEEGTIADLVEDLYKETRRSTGIGIRMVMNSGLVYRAEYATGEEGGQFVLFLGYPWDIF
ncbi:hypothetical protein KJ966_14760 [bacterium]|nr:hypothetical protein [bacterium]